MNCDWQFQYWILHECHTGIGKLQFADLVSKTELLSILLMTLTLTQKIPLHILIYFLKVGSIIILTSLEFPTKFLYKFISLSLSATCYSPRTSHRSWFDLFLFLSVFQQPNAGQGRLILEVSRSHTMTQHSRSPGHYTNWAKTRRQ
jgi:hypothetical protein